MLVSHLIECVCVRVSVMRECVCVCVCVCGWVVIGERVGREMKVMLLYSYRWSCKYCVCVCVCVVPLYSYCVQNNYVSHQWPCGVCDRVFQCYRYTKFVLTQGFLYGFPSCVV